ncbi:MAG: AAA domain-containing protein, partial [Acidobacteriota bacterium]
KGYERFGPVVDLRQHRGGAVDPLIQLYDRALRQRKRPPLLDAICREGPATPLPAERERAALEGHTGQMTDRFGLGQAQRRALAAALALDDGELLAVNGPPGTGKTTLIQSLVASLWVRRALDGGDPPLQVVCSNNNRAVTQVLDTFADALEDRRDGGEDAVTERWLPGIPSLGLYLPAYSRKLTEDGRLCVARRTGATWTGFPDRVESKGYVSEGRRHYLERAHRFFGRPFDDVRAVVDALHGRLRRRDAELRELRRDAGLGALPDGTGDVAPSPPRPPDGDERRRLEAELGEVRGRLEELGALRREVDAAIDELPAWEDLLARLDTVRDRRDERLTAPFRKRGLEPPPIPAKAFRRGLHRHVEALGRTDVERRGVLEAAIARHDAERGRAEAWRRRLSPLAEAAGDGDRLDQIAADPEALESLFDRTLRRRLFLLAGRYWEGRWLLDVDTTRPEERTRQSKTFVQRRFRRWSMLTPVTIATLYQLPKIYTYFDGEQRTLFGAVDQLIVDEAGQVAPEVGGVVFSLAKRAVAFGDVHQLEPIWNVPAAADVGNLSDAGIERERLEDIEEGFGVKASEGSLMRVARRATRWSDPGSGGAGERGVWLLDHRRSVPEVVRFCNRLVYGGRLRPRRPALPRSSTPSTRIASEDRPAHPLPAFGWAHVASDAEASGSSRRNAGHAASIADWLRRRRDELESHYGRPIGEIVGVVTPYSAQISTLVDACRAEQLPVAGAADGPPIAVGTVHTFQGGERPVMLFSPVVTRRQPGYFIDRRPNLLNVAVSRARDAFLVFGDLAVFDPDVGRPSGVLAQHLFEHPGQELRDALPAPELRDADMLRAVEGDDAHRALLREAIAAARRRVLVVSPTLDGRTLDVLGLEPLIGRSAARGVRCVIAYCPGVSANSAETEACVERLRGAGAHVIALKRYLARILAVDKDAYVAGTFDWLSFAGRTELPGPPPRSLRVDGHGAVEAVKDAWRDMREVRIPDAES